MDELRDSMAAVHAYPVRVYYEDTDAAGIVYYANYLKFAERARTEMLRDMGFDQIRIRDEDDAAFAVRACSVDYKSPARLDDALVVHTGVEKVGGASIGLLQTVTRDQQMLVVMHITLVCIRRDGRAGRVPANVRRALEAMMNSLKEV
jgi:acyl-CoA thioester hydrolase